MTDPVVELLNGYKYEVLLQIATENGIPMGAGAGLRPSKEALIETLRACLFTPDYVASALGHLNELERSALDRLLLHPGDMPTVVLRDELQREGIVLPGPRKGQIDFYEGDAFDPQRSFFEDVLARLTLRGLVFSVGHPTPWTMSKLGLSPGNVLVIPSELRKLLPKPALPPVEWGRGNLPAPVDETSSGLAQRDLFIYWSCVRAQSVPLTQAGLLQKRALRAINEQLLSPDLGFANAMAEDQSPRLYFLRLLLQELGLLVREHGQLRAAGMRSRVPDVWAQPRNDRTKTCLQAWAHMREWSEISSLNVSTVSFDLPQARSVLLDQLRLLVPGTWISAERFLQRLAIIAPRLLFQARESTMRTSSHAVRQVFDTGYAARQSHWFAEVEAAFVGGALSGPLHWLGVLDICADESRLLAFCINADGARVLGLPGARAEDTAEARLVVQPNFQILALGPISEAVLATLEMFAERVKVDPSAFEYLLTRDTVYRAQKMGLPTPEIAAFLEQTCGSPLPQNVLRTLQEWGQQHERIVFHRSVALCQTSSPEIMERLWADPLARGHFERALNPEVSIVRRGRTLALQEKLLQDGMLPASPPKGDACVGRIRANADGLLSPVREGPDLWLQSCLRPLAEEQGGHFYVTEQAVSHALASGMTVSDYLRRLAAVHHGPLPAHLQANIKAWGHYYGAASLLKATLLEVKDAATADDLLANPELAPLLSRFSADPRGRLLLVRTNDLDRLRQMLGDLGIELA